MAFLFSDDEDVPKTNVIGEANQNVASPNVMPTTTDTPAPSVSTTSAPAASSAPSSSVVTQSQSTAAPKGGLLGPSPSQVSSRMRSAASRQRAPDLSGIGGQIQEQEQKLAEEGAAYSAKQQENAQSLKIDKSLIDKALGGDTASLSDLSGRLSKTKADQVEAFKGLGIVDDKTGALKSTYGQAGLLGAGNPYYSGGQRAFDARLLGRNQQLQSDAKAMIDRQAALQKASDTDAAARTASAQQGMQTNLDLARQSARGIIDEDMKKLVFDAQLRELQEEAARGQIDQKAVAAAKAAEIQKRAMGEYGTLPEGSLDRRALQQFDPAQDLSPYLSLDADVDWRELISEDQAARYNRGLGLLGSGGASLSAGLGAGDPYAFDEKAAYEAMLGSARQKVMKADEEAAAAEAARRASSDPQVIGGAPVKPNVNKTTQYLDDAAYQIPGILTAPAEALPASVSAIHEQLRRQPGSQYYEPIMAGVDEINAPIAGAIGKASDNVKQASQDIFRKATPAVLRGKKKGKGLFG